MTLSLRIYIRLLAFYPDDLRRDYAADMALVFADDLAAACREAGPLGVLRVWRCALAEFLRFALPGHLASPVVRVPAISLALFVLMMCGVMTMAIRQAPDAHTFFRAVRAALLLPLFVTPVIALLSVWACRGRTITSLHHEDR